MLEHRLFGSTLTRRRPLRPMVLAVFSYRYDAELVPDLLANIEPVVDGWVAFDDRRASDLFSNEPLRRNLLIKRARELGATWVMALDPDERIERGAATRVRAYTSERRRIIWQLNLREMFTTDAYRVDGLWGGKLQGRLFPVFDGPLCSEQLLHGAWCTTRAGYSVLPIGLNLYHLKMISHNRRLARRNLYNYLDPAHRYQTTGYDYLIDEDGGAFERIPANRDFFPAHHEANHLNFYMPDITCGTSEPSDAIELRNVTCNPAAPPGGSRKLSQLAQLRISVGDKVSRESKLAVVVIGLRAPKALFDAVSSLINQDQASEIIVVNSGGGNVQDVLGEYVRSIVLVEHERPIFVGAARNLGIQVSCAPFVAFLAGDCVAAQGWVAERTKAHREGERAVACVVDNDKRRNPFAWGAHLMTYGHRMVDAPVSEVMPHGASYDRALFNKYGYFSETMVVGEDSEFNGRFGHFETVELHPTIRTIHCNPGKLTEFLSEQFHRGRRGRYLADFLRVDFSVAYIISETARRFTRAVRLSVKRLHGTERLSAIACWVFLPVGVLCYLSGMIASYARVAIAERHFRRATRTAVLGRPAAAVTLLTRAIDLRPATSRYYRVLGAILKHLGQYDASARALYASWDIDRLWLSDLYGAGGATDSADAEANKSTDRLLRFQLVIFSDSSVVELAEFLGAIGAQQFPLNQFSVLIVETRVRHNFSEHMRQVQRSYSNLASFISLAELPYVLKDEVWDGGTEGRSFVVVSSCSCVPSPDWLKVLAAYIKTYPEVELFHGTSPPVEGASFVARLGYDLGLFPRTAGRGGVLQFAHHTNWACDKSLLFRSGGVTGDEMQALGVCTLTERVRRVGGSGVYAADWQALYRMDSTLIELLRRFYEEGWYAAQHVAATKDRDFASNVFPRFGPRGSIAAVLRFTNDNFKVWRFSHRAFVLYVPAFLLLMLVGIARHVGWIAGLRRNSHYLRDGAFRR
jgi:glycosyltransferase involved in cell wall biosynthesis